MQVQIQMYFRYTTRMCGSFIGAAAAVRFSIFAHLGAYMKSVLTLYTVLV
jgi:hypothetical protein